jgi:hypothetical protein
MPDEIISNKTAVAERSYRRASRTHGAMNGKAALPPLACLRFK